MRRWPRQAANERKLPLTPRWACQCTTPAVACCRQSSVCCGCCRAQAPSLQDGGEGGSVGPLCSNTTGRQGRSAAQQTGDDAAQAQHSRPGASTLIALCTCGRRIRPLQIVNAQQLFGATGAQLPSGVAAGKRHAARNVLVLQQVRQEGGQGGISIGATEAGHAMRSPAAATQLLPCPTAGAAQLAGQPVSCHPSLQPLLGPPPGTGAAHRQWWHSTRGR